MTEDEVKEILKGEFTLVVPNFHKWNPPRKEKSTWVKLDCHWDQDLRVRPLCPTSQLLWVKIVSLLGTSGEPHVSLTLGTLQARVNLRSTSCKVSLLKLWKSGLIELLKKERKKQRKTPETAAAENSPELTPKNLEILRKEFGEKLVEEHLKSALATWEAYEPYRQSQILPIQTVQRYLRNVKKDEAKADKTKSAEEVIAAAWKKLEPPRV